MESLDLASYILTLDIGTSSTRAVLFDEKARPVPGCIIQVSNRLQTAHDGTAVFDVAHLFENTVQAIDRLLQTADEHPGRIVGVAVDTLVSNVFGADETGQPMTPIYTYADTRNAPDAATLRSELGLQGQAAAHDRTGCLIHTSYLPARFRWLARTQPDLLKRATHWLSIGEYVLWRFTGTRAVSYSVASWTGLLDRRTLTWDAEWLTDLPISAAQLSPLTDLDQPVSALHNEWTARWPSLADAVWFPAVGDGAAANVGSGCGTLPAARTDATQRIALTIGTTGAMRTVLNAKTAAEQTVPSGLWFYRVDAQRGLLGGATTEGGNLYAWLRSTLQLPDTDVVEATLRERAPAVHGLTVLPFVAGERAPGWDDDARASLLDFTLHTEPLDILQASLEGIAYRFALIYERIRASLFPGQVNARAAAQEVQIIASGGAILSSPVWLQIMADVLNQPVIALEEREITARGLAILALEKLNLVADAATLEPRLGQTYQPDGERHAIHMDALQRQVARYRQLRT